MILSGLRWQDGWKNLVLKGINTIPSKKEAVVRQPLQEY